MWSWCVHSHVHRRHFYSDTDDTRPFHLTGDTTLLQTRRKICAIRKVHPRTVAASSIYYDLHTHKFQCFLGTWLTRSKKRRYLRESYGLRTPFKSIHNVKKRSLRVFQQAQTLRNRSVTFRCAFFAVFAFLTRQLRVPLLQSKKRENMRRERDQKEQTSYYH